MVCVCSSCYSSSMVTDRFIKKVKSDSEPMGMGTRSATHSNFPTYSGNALVVAIAATVVVGIILDAPVRPIRKFFFEEASTIP